MNAMLSRRLSRLEQIYNRLPFEERGGPELTVIKVRGGLYGCVPCQGHAGGLTLEREPGETEEDFTERVLDMARGTGANFAVINGLPPGGDTLDDSEGIDDLR